MAKKKPTGKKKVTSKKKTPKKKTPKKKTPGKVAKKATAPRKPATRAAGAARRKPPAKRAVAALPAEKQVEGGVLLGQVEDYFAHVGVMALKLLAPVSVGNMIRIKGHTTDITQKVESMQIEHQPVQTASAGDSVGIKIADRTRRTDIVYRI